MLAIVLVAINPARQFSQANDTKRSSDVNAILNAIHQYMADNQDQVPPGIVETPADVGSTELCGALVTAYIAALPTDPLSSLNGDPMPSDCAAAVETGYQVSVSAADRRITVAAPLTEVAAEDITVTR